MKAYALPVAIIALAAALVVSVFMFNAVPVESSVITGGEYQSSQVSAAGTSTLKTYPGSIGSVVLTSTSGAGGAISFYATTSQATSSADLIFSFDATASENTYVYDVAFGKGLLIEANPSFDGDAVITFR